jgi:hypothetical protein
MWPNLGSCDGVGLKGLRKTKKNSTQDVGLNELFLWNTTE